MKRLLTIMLFVLAVMMTQRSVVAGEYRTYQSITFENTGAKLLENYSRDEYDRYFNRVSKRRFWGWRTFTVMSNEPVSYQKETLYVIVNEGTSSINKNYYFKTAVQSKYQISASGNVGVSASGNIRAFKLGLDSHVRPSVSYERSGTREERVDIRIEIDPDTVLRVEVYGEGKVTNGVAKYYRFWRNIRSGGWEVFVMTTEYFSIVKEAIEVDEDISDDSDVDLDD